VKVGLIVDEGGPSVSQPEARESAQATVAYANASLGGMDGHKIELVICKNKEDTASATACANQMVQSNVVATLLTGGGIGAVMVPIITKAGIPYVIPTGAAAEEYTTKGAFDLTSGLPGLLGARAKYAAESGKKSVTMFLQDAGTFVATTKAIATPAFAAAGVKLKIVPVPNGTADATAVVTAGVADHPDVVDVIGGATTCIATFKGLDAVGSTAQRWMGPSCFTDAVEKAVSPKNFDNAVVIDTNVDGATSSDPDAVLFRAIMAKYSPSTTLTGPAAYGFQVVLSFLRTTTGMTGDITAATTLNQIETAKNVKLALGAGLTFTCDGKASPGSISICGSGALIKQINNAKVTSEKPA
jgi:branched-chain amino acid transport system substrate-binding protein